MNIQFNNSNGMDDILKVYFHKNLPSVNVKDQRTLVDVLASILYNTKNLRYGPIPEPEPQVKVRQVIRDYIGEERPIPILVPWGSIKADFSPTLDIAELSALSILKCLNEQVKQYYEPGLQIAIRIEDLSGFRLFSMEPNIDAIKANSTLYSKDFSKLINIIGSDFMIPRLESEMTKRQWFLENEPRLTDMVDKYLHHTDFMSTQEIMKYITGGGDTFKALQNEMWRGIISREQRDHYLTQYAKLYPDYDRGSMLYRLALYFGGSLARHRANMAGDLPEWRRNYIQLAFIPPVKGLPEGYNNNYIYYRTIPANESRTHLAPWRAKGYLKIEGRNAIQKICTFSDKPNDLVPCSATISSKSESVRVRMDYLEI